uniref:Uncharacterized protein n=1 Tax=Anguilla anguilla TaxID=7936 RepID=A0A0E9PLN8_ANGAN
MAMGLMANSHSHGAPNICID